MNNKELVKFGHALAKAISNDTPLIEIAKMVSNLAIQLDVQIARSNQLSIALEAAEKRIAELEDAEKKTVEMPTFGGYVPHVARELQAAFRIACDNAGINITAAGKGE